MAMITRPCAEHNCPNMTSAFYCAEHAPKAPPALVRASWSGFASESLQGAGFLLMSYAMSDTQKLPRTLACIALIAVGIRHLVRAWRALPTRRRNA